jgi:hypothetical protein
MDGWRRGRTVRGLAAGNTPTSGFVRELTVLEARGDAPDTFNSSQEM